jgi:hypothetical protein
MLNGIRADATRRRCRCRRTSRQMSHDSGADVGLSLGRLPPFPKRICSRTDQINPLRPRDIGGTWATPPELGAEVKGPISPMSRHRNAVAADIGDSATRHRR